MSVKKQKEEVKDLKLFLRENAPQVKTFLIDHLFTGAITVYEREDLGPEGYKTIETTFDTIEELKQYYVKSKVSVSAKKPIKRIRTSTKTDSKRVKKAMAKSKPKKTNIRRDNVRVRKARG